MTSREPTKTRPPAWEAFALIGGGLALVAVLFAWLAWSRPGGARRLSVVDPGAAPAARGPYAGSKVCADCHPGESALYSRSGHSQTLRAAAASAAAKRLDGRSVEDPERAGVTWSYALRGGAFAVERADKATGEVERLLLAYAFGSGHHAVTFVTVTDPDKPAALEHRMTYYPPSDRLEVTPGQRVGAEVGSTTARGRPLPPENTLKCFGCHATPADEVLETEPGGPPLPKAGPLTPNITCERCHGPARAHVEAARHGRTGPALAMPFGLAGGTAGAQLGLCGQCHRHPVRIPAARIRPDDPDLARFQPVGLMQSKCYTRSGGAFRCTTCHDPHGRASSEVARYEAACLGCHAPATADAVASARKVGVACHVSPRSGCLGCHMPKVDTGQSVLFTDHWIRVRPEHRPPAGDEPSR
jgi:hypothetical protein